MGVTLVGVLNGTSGNFILDALLLLAFVDFRPSRITFLCCGEGSCNLFRPSTRCRPSFDPLLDSIVTPIAGGVEVRDFIAALETAPEVMAAAVGVVVLGLVVILLLLLAAII